MTLRISRVPAGSRPLVGSSSTTSLRGTSNAAARPRRCFMPSEYPRYRRCAACASPTRSSASSTACLIVLPRQQWLERRAPDEVLPPRQERVEPRTLDQRADVRQRLLGPVGQRPCRAVRSPPGWAAPTRAASGSSSSCPTRSARACRARHPPAARGRRGPRRPCSRTPCADPWSARRQPRFGGRCHRRAGRGGHFTCPIVSNRTCSGTAPATTRPSSAIRIVATLVLNSLPLPHAPLTFLREPVDHALRLGGHLGHGLAGDARADDGVPAGAEDLRVLALQRLLEPDLGRGRVCCSSLASGVVTLAPAGGVNSNSFESCAPTLISLKPTCAAGSRSCRWSARRPAAASCSSESTAIRTSRISVFSLAFGVSTSS